MSWIRELFSDHKGKLSIMRVMAMIALLAAITLAFTNHDPTIIATFLAFAGGGHIAGKYVESTTRPDKNENV
jgi:hypothetical protein